MLVMGIILPSVLKKCIGYYPKLSRVLTVCMSKKMYRSIISSLCLLRWEAGTQSNHFRQLFVAVARASALCLIGPQETKSDAETLTLPSAFLDLVPVVSLFTPLRLTSALLTHSHWRADDWERALYISLPEEAMHLLL